MFACLLLKGGGGGEGKEKFLGGRPPPSWSTPRFRWRCPAPMTLRRVPIYRLDKYAFLTSKPSFSYRWAETCMWFITKCLCCYRLQQKGEMFVSGLFVQVISIVRSAAACELLNKTSSQVAAFTVSFSFLCQTVFPWPATLLFHWIRTTNWAS